MPGARQAEAALANGAKVLVLAAVTLDTLSRRGGQAAGKG